jgi:hypothetical protein
MVGSLGKHDNRGWGRSLQGVGQRRFHGPFLYGLQVRFLALRDVVGLPVEFLGGGVVQAAVRSKVLAESLADWFWFDGFVALGFGIVSDFGLGI